MIVTLVINSLWQGALVVGISALVLGLVPQRNATTRYAVWFLALLALVAIPLATTASHFGAQLVPLFAHRRAAANASFALVPIGALAIGTGKWLAWAPALGSSGILPAIGALWSAGAALGLLRLVMSFVRISRVRRCATALFFVDGVPILASDELSVPIATGITAPVIVLPSLLAETLSETDLRCTIEHELAHIRRGDVAGNAMQRIAESILFWNPWIHVVGRRLVAEREGACDDWAVRRIGESAEYAACLATLARRIIRAAPPLLTPSAFGSRNALVARIERLMGDHSPDDSSINYFALGALTVLFAIMTLALQALLPAAAGATPLQPTAATSIVAADGACKNPNAGPTASNAVAPNLPKSQWPQENVSAIVLVTVSASGKATAARVSRSSGYANVDRAVLTAAEKSAYSPKLVNCIPSAGSYLFKAQFSPQAP